MCYTRITISLQIILKLKLQTTRFKSEKLLLLGVWLASRMNYFSTWRISKRRMVRVSFLLIFVIRVKFHYSHRWKSNCLPGISNGDWQPGPYVGYPTLDYLREIAADYADQLTVDLGALATEQARLASARPPDTLPARAPLPRHKSRGPHSLMLVRKVKCTNSMSSLQCAICSSRFRLIVS